MSEVNLHFIEGVYCSSDLIDLLDKIGIIDLKKNFDLYKHRYRKRNLYKGIHHD